MRVKLSPVSDKAKRTADQSAISFKGANMPRNVRNFWIDLDVDGRASRVSTGPRRKDGGFQLDIKMRTEGDIFNPVTIYGRANPDGTLSLKIFDNGAGEKLTEFVVKR